MRDLKNLPEQDQDWIQNYGDLNDNALRETKQK